MSALEEVTIYIIAKQNTVIKDIYSFADLIRSIPSTRVVIYLWGDATTAKANKTSTLYYR